MPAPTVSGGAGGGGIRILHLNKKTSIPEFQHTRNEWRAERRAALLDADELDELIVRVKNVTSGHRLAGGDIPQFEIVLQSKGLRYVICCSTLCHHSFCPRPSALLPNRPALVTAGVKIRFLSCLSF